MTCMTLFGVLEMHGHRAIILILVGISLTCVNTFLFMLYETPCCVFCTNMRYTVCTTAACEHHFWCEQSLQCWEQHVNTATRQNSYSATWVLTLELRDTFSNNDVTIMTRQDKTVTGRLFWSAQSSLGWHTRSNTRTRTGTHVYMHTVSYTGSTQL